MDLIVEPIEIVTIPIEVTTASTVVNADDNCIEVVAKKKEFSVVGDSIYIGNRMDESPQWLIDYIDQLNSLALDDKINSINGLSQSVEDLIEAMNVAKNAYESAIITYEELELMVNAKLETLNSSLRDADATIIGILSTKVTPAEAQALATQVLDASLANGAINALVAGLQQAIATETAARATDVNLVRTSLDDMDTQFSEAITGIESSIEDQGDIVAAHAQQFTNLAAGIGTGNWAGTGVDNSLSLAIGEIEQRAESNFSYNSSLTVNGITSNSGFGLVNSASSVAGKPTSGSEFWIDATKFKFTNSANTGASAPFTIDASGATPEITFNGKVSFSNVSGAPGGSGNLLYNSAPALGNEQKGWQIGGYNTNIVPVLGSGSDPWRPSGGGSVYATIPGAPTIGGAFSVLQTNRVPVVGGSWYDASAYTSSHRCTSYVTIAWYDSNNTYINEVGGSQVATAGGGALVNWGRTVLFAQAPANAAKASFYVRSIVNSNDPYCFVAFAYLGKSVVGQTVHSDWSEGTSAGVTRTGELTNDAGFTTLSAVASQGYVLPAGVAHAINTNTTTINGAKITTGSITANQINVTDLFSKNITYTGVITGGNVAGGGIIKSYNGKMVIDLVNGSIYIA